jgi:hypothetical protein
VFNGSASEPDQDSLNDVLEAGPICKKTSLVSIWNFELIGTSADIQKAILQFGLAKQDRDLVRCLWVDVWVKKSSVKPI